MGNRPRVRDRGLGGADVAQRAGRIAARRSGTSSRASGPTSSCSCIPGISTRACSGPIARLRRIPTVLDVFISLYDTVVVDRGLRSTRSPIALATRAARHDGVLERAHGRGRHARARRLLRALHAPRPVALRGAVGRCRRRRGSSPADDPGDDAPILWYLTYIPLHGFETVARAAALLADDGRTFRLVGDGQQRADGRAARRELGLTNIEFVAPVPEAELPAEIARASICLGVFGTSDKAARVVPNKVFQCAAAGRAVVTAATPAVINAFGDALVTVPVGDAAALADALPRAARHLRLAVAVAARTSGVRSAATPKPRSPTSSAAILARPARERKG